jgi:hypothetical protein
MENNYVFRSIEVVGATKEDAFASQDTFTAPVENWRNATQAFRNWKQSQTEAITDAAVKEFMREYIRANKIAPGAAAYIVNEPAVKDTRKRAYTIEDVKREGGTTHYGKVFELCEKLEDGTIRVLASTPCEMVPQTDDEGNRLLDEDGNVRMKVSSATKAEAKNLAKALITEKGYKGAGFARLVRKVATGDDVVFTFSYTPSKSAQNGVYTVFGLEIC